MGLTTLTCYMRPLLQYDAPGNLPALCEVPKYHERADSTPNSAQKGVDEEDAWPPISPEEVEGKIMLPVLGPKKKQRHNSWVHISCKSAEMVQIWGPILRVGAQQMSLSFESVRRHVWTSARNAWPSAKYSKVDEMRVEILSSCHAYKTDGHSFVKLCKHNFCQQIVEMHLKCMFIDLKGLNLKLICLGQMSERRKLLSQGNRASRFRRYLSFACIKTVCITRSVDPSRVFAARITQNLQQSMEIKSSSRYETEYSLDILIFPPVMLFQ